MVNDEVKEIFIKRTRIFNAMREFINQFGYLEVDTSPAEHPGGAAARPFITPQCPRYRPHLRIANELYLKRLIVGGFEGVYEFARDSATRNGPHAQS